MTIPVHPNATNRLPVGSANAGYVSVKQYAQHQGVTPAAIYQRIHAGQLGDAVHRAGGRYLIHQQRADLAWATHGKPCNSQSARLEARLMASADRIADELAGQPADYCRVAMWRWVAELVST